LRLLGHCARSDTCFFGGSVHAYFCLSARARVRSGGCLSDGNCARLWSHAALGLSRVHVFGACWWFFYRSHPPVRTSVCDLRICLAFGGCLSSAAPKFSSASASRADRRKGFPETTGLPPAPHHNDAHLWR